MRVHVLSGRPVAILVSLLLVAQLEGVTSVRGAGTSPPPPAKAPASATAPATVPAVTPAPSPAPGPSPAPSPGATASPTASPPSPPPTGTPAPDASPTLSPGGIEQTELRTADSRTFLMSDGTYATDFFTEARYYQPAGVGAWQPIDTTFSPGPGGTLHVSQSPAQVTLSAASASAFAAVTAKGRTISFSLPVSQRSLTAATPQAASGGRVAEYSNFLPGGIGLRVVARSDGIKSFLVLPGPPIRNTFSFSVSAAGLTLATQGDGSVAFVDSSGQTVANIPRPYLVDSSNVEAWAAASTAKPCPCRTRARQAATCSR